MTDCPADHGDQRVWHVVGDSHVAAIDHAAKAGWLSRRCRFTEVPGATAVGMRNPNSLTHALEIFSRSLLPPRPGTIPLIQLGEVDCGFVIWWRAKTYAETIEHQLRESVCAYLSFVDRLLGAGHSDVVITGAALPTIRDGTVWGDIANFRKEVDATLKDRTALTIEYNDRLRSGAAQRQCAFIDLTSDLLDPDTGVISEYYRNEDPSDHHMHPERVGKLWAYHLNSLSGR